MLPMAVTSPQQKGENKMTKRMLLTINYKNGNTMKELVNYIHFEDGSIFYTRDVQIQQSITAPSKTPLENVESFDLEEVTCEG